MYEIKNSKQVQLTDRVRFRCTRCGECCKHVQGVVVIDAYDAYRLTKHLAIPIEEFYAEYADPFLLEDTGFPIFTLRSVGKEHRCVFLDGKKCTVQDAKPRTCRMYPFWIGPGEKSDDFTYYLCTERRHHLKGTLVRVKDWMQQNFPEDEKEYLISDSSDLEKIAPLHHELQRKMKDKDKFLTTLCAYRYLMFDTKKPFLEQLKRNNHLLITAMEQELKKIASDQNHE